MGLTAFNTADHLFQSFADKEELNAAATDWFTNRLREVLATKNTANLALSGGSTPREVYKALSSSDLPWHQVSATLVDERLEAGAEGSNGKMIADLLAANKAHGINLVDMVDADPLIHSGFDICLLGMGTDGHTASWFPGAKPLEDALDIDTEKTVIEINAAGCPGAGEFSRRMTLTLPPVMNSDALLLLITGAEKLKAFKSATDKSVFDAPVKALLAAGSRLTVMWAP